MCDCFAVPANLQPLTTVNCLLLTGNCSATISPSTLFSSQGPPGRLASSPDCVIFAVRILTVHQYASGAASSASLSCSFLSALSFSRPVSQPRNSILPHQPSSGQLVISCFFSRTSSQPAAEFHTTITGCFSSTGSFCINSNLCICCDF
ncbi:hypothetical protein TherJR_2118 [Thermincola potens JR]|uniref:Uncharacterized protein n=1 Tax=Thermincola potens (strain JR) TaxID=635013 RepID=D5X8T7_THEPJ|nr:hypothetical protein TherJR_2118 [Thermincola potens JR]